MKLVFDIETNGLLWQLDHIWLLCTIDIDTGEERVYSDFDNNCNGSLAEGIEYLFSAETIIGHNIIGFDLLAIRKIFNKEYEGKIVDTLLWSQVLNYKRFGFGHSLGRWGEFLGHHKPEHEDWDNYSPEMRVRCTEDTRINKKVWDVLLKEFLGRKKKDLLSIGIESEHYVARFCADAEYYGWPIDYNKAMKVKNDLENEMDRIKSVIEPKLKLKVKQFDKDPEFKKPVWVANGWYAARTCQWFDVAPESGLDSRPIWGDYCRVEVIKPDIGSLESVKELLYSLGWEPDEWNWKRDAKGKLVKTTPKLSEDSLLVLGEVGEAINNFYTLRSRYSILESWLEAVDGKGRLHGNCFTIGTPTFRARHAVIANIPSENAPYGPEIREIFTVEAGMKQVGADSSGNQLRGLCHYIDDPEFTKEVIEGDIHTFNKTIIESVFGSLGDKGRKIAKTFIYAFLYAAGDGKLGLVVSGIRDTELGAKLKKKFMARIPGLGRLIEKIEKQYALTESKTGKGYVMGLDSRFVYADSKRLALNYLLQSCEKITCSASVMWGMKEMARQGIWYQPLIMYHDFEFGCG